MQQTNDASSVVTNAPCSQGMLTIKVIGYVGGVQGPSVLSLQLSVNLKLF